MTITMTMVMTVIRMMTMMTMVVVRVGLLGSVVLINGLY